MKELIKEYFQNLEDGVEYKFEESITKDYESIRVGVAGEPGWDHWFEIQNGQLYRYGEPYKLQSLIKT
jgi:hypothetical protein